MIKKYEALEKKYKEIKNLNETSQKNVFKKNEHELNSENEKLKHKNEELMNFEIKCKEMENTIKEFQHKLEEKEQKNKNLCQNLEIKISEITNVLNYVYFYNLFRKKTIYLKNLKQWRKNMTKLNF